MPSKQPMTNPNAARETLRLIPGSILITGAAAKALNEEMRADYEAAKQRDERAHDPASQQEAAAPPEAYPQPDPARRARFQTRDTAQTLER